MLTVHWVSGRALGCGLSACVAAFVGLVAGPAWGAASFQRLGDLPGGQTFSQAVAVSADGSVVVGNGSAGGSEPGSSVGRAWRWTAGSSGLVGLGELPGGFENSSVAAVSPDGGVIVGGSDSDFGGGSAGFEAFVYTAGSGMTGLGDLPGGRTNSRALGVSSGGGVIVGSSSSGRAGTSNPDGATEAFRREPGGALMGLGTLPNVGLLGESGAVAVSNDGSVIVGVSDSRFGAASGPVRSEAFRWTASGGMVGLGDLPGGVPSSVPAAVSADGSVVVGNSSSDFGVGGFGFEAFRWTQRTGMVGLGDLPGGTLSSNAFGVSADGQRIVGNTSTDAATFFEAYLWEPDTGMRRLQDVLIDAGLGSALSGWTLVSARDISDDGMTIVGSGRNPLGETEAWVATLPLSGVGGLAGDFNGNGSVEQADLDLVLSGWGGSRVGFSNAGGFLTGAVDQEELDAVLSNWGTVGSPSFGGVVVPEPAAGLGLGLCLGLVAGRGGRRRGA